MKQYNQKASRRQKVFLAAFSLTIPLLAGCGGSSGSISSQLMTPQPRSVSKTATNGLTATFAENVDAVGPGGAVTYTVTLTNSFTQPVTLQLYGCPGSPPDPSRPNAFLNVADADGTLVYTTAPIPIPCAAAPPVTQTIAAGQSLTIQFQGISSQAFKSKGVYLASAVVSTSTGNADQLGPLTMTVQ